jgi:1-acyl-sn-glycerol-3-phosphate acyltransferase
VASPNAQNDVRLLRILHQVNRLVCRGYHRVEVTTPCPIPLEGAGILVCNHISHLDPLALQSACRRTIVWMMAREFYDLKGMHWLFRTLRGIPVDRSGRDTAATRQALRALKDGHLLGIFPEGGIGTPTRMKPLQTGAALMAIRMNVPLWTAHIHAPHPPASFLRTLVYPQELRLTFGNRIDLEGLQTSTSDLENANLRIFNAIDRLSSVPVVA